MSVWFGASVGCLLLVGCGPDWGSLLRGATRSVPDASPDAGGGVSLGLQENQRLVRMEPDADVDGDAGVDAGRRMPEAR